jgi:hypothetical protein
MNKKILTFVALMALVALPAAALAAPAPGATTGGWEFTLGGFVKLDTFWDSTSYSKNMNTAVARNNDPNFHHGKLRFTAQGSRFNFTIKGPDLWGAKTSAFIEIDFDRQDIRESASFAYIPRMRHAMFRMNWPQTELLFGQYWSFLCEFYPELAQDGPFQLNGAATHRLAQIRVTQKFGRDSMFRVAAMVGMPTDPDTTRDAIFETNQNRATLFPYAAGQGVAGATAETPQVQGLIAFEKDLYGKAAFYGKPRGFVAQVAAAWQRTRYRNNVVGFNGRTWGQDIYNTANASFQDDNQYLHNWIVQGSLFIPVIPTRTANLAGTASISTQWYVGQGISAFGLGQEADNSYYKWSSPIFNANNAVIGGIYDVTLQNRYGGYIQGQYYFTNQWFMTAAYGMSKAFGVTQERNIFVNSGGPLLDRSKYMTANNDQMKTMQQFAMALWYQPITSVKFALQYTYTRTDYFQKQRGFDPNLNAFGTRITDVGENHRVQFVGLYFF